MVTIGLVGAPSSAAGHWPGMEKAPGFLRAAELPRRLAEGGVTVVDHGDLPQIRWRPDSGSPNSQNVGLVAGFLSDVAQRVDAAATEGQLPVVIGGECTVTMGVLAGLARHHDSLGLMYVDGHVDLNTPVSTGSGVLDSMVMAHLLGLEGTRQELRALSGRAPQLRPEDVVLFGYNEEDMNPIEVAELPRIPVASYPLSRVRGDVRGLAREALDVLESKVSAFVLHLDVDVISFTDFPIADVPSYHHQGLTFTEAMECVEVFASSGGCVGVVVTEINPDHATEALADRFTQGLAGALTGSRSVSR